jgi:putative tricarboxylic transport membrane protein
MVDSMFEAFSLIGAGDVLIAFMLGIIAGTVIGVLPGVGLLVGFALALPFIVDLEPVVALAFLLAMYSQAATAGDLTAIAFGVPGTPASASLVVDGHEMVKRGEVGMAFGAALSASALGAIIGIVPLIFLVPFAKPLVLSIQSPEIFVLTVIGVTIIASVSGKSLLKGLVAGGLGFTFAAFGPETQFGIIRFGFGNYYLLDGIALLPLAIGVFAIPELIDLHSRKSSIVQEGELKAKYSDMWRGAKATFSNFGLVVRTSLIGMGVGFVPGLGATVGQWLAYGHAVTFSKEPKSFGHGDIRGVIAPGGANNSKDGGELLPTVAFGVPGSPPMALLLAAMILLGVPPGPDMVGKNAHLTYFMLFILVFGNLAGVIVSTGIARFLGSLLGFKGAYLVPVVIVFLFVGAGASSGRIGDIIVLLVGGALAWLMRLYGWPIIPLVLGFVLGDRAEETMWRTHSAYGFDWLTRRGVVILLVIALALTLIPPILKWRSRDPELKDALEDEQLDSTILSAGSLAFNAVIVLFGLFIMILPMLYGWPQAASLFPIVFGFATAFLAMIQLIRDSFRLRAVLRASAGGLGPAPASDDLPAVAHDDSPAVAHGDLALAPDTGGTSVAVAEPEVDIVGRGRVIMVMLAVTGFAIYLIGTPLALAAYLTYYLRREGETSWLTGAAVGALIYVVIQYGMVGLLDTRLPPGIWLST